MSVVVALTLDEIRAVAIEAIGRRIYAMRMGFRSFNGSGLGLWEQDIQGAAAEAAVCKQLGIAWRGTVGDLTQRDAGDIEVRWTSRPGGALYLREKDAPDARFILVEGFTPRFTLVGWISGAEGKSIGRKTYSDERGAWSWRVDRAQLRPLRVPGAERAA